MTVERLVHDPEERQQLLQPLRFLIGHFRGEGRYANRAGTFHKEVIGTWEAGGRFVGLRMSLTYPLQDGRQDNHEALVIVGTASTPGQFTAQAYTDGGDIITHQLERDGEAFVFPDRPPTGHGLHVIRARKWLTPTRDGFEERLEIDQGDGHFTLYSVIPMIHTGSDA